ncbi:MAG: hypothetical protein AMS21_00945 [Gemmatimonas sp. SG8_38_2]|nr:MAG: hypothetical protein AMS21_00945 [Gemmatimonas sp. SG8_38_2]
MEETKSGIILAKAEDIQPKISHPDAVPVDVQAVMRILNEGKRQTMELIAAQLRKILMIADARPTNDKGRRGRRKKFQMQALHSKAIGEVRKLARALEESIRGMPPLEMPLVKKEVEHAQGDTGRDGKVVPLRR